MADLLQRIYTAFSLDPLTPEQESLYVDLDEARGTVGVVNRLATKIRLADRPTCQVLSGHGGSGKSTELRRLGHELRHGNDSAGKFFVVLCDIGHDVDPYDVSFPDILIGIIRQMAAQLKGEGISLASSYFKDRWNRLKGILASDVRIEDFELDLGMLKLAGAIRSSPDIRRQIREAFEPDTGNWLSAANEVIRQAETELRTRQYRGLVILVDNLDKIPLRPHGDTGYSTAEYLYVHRAAQFTALACHVVYTMPLELAYSHHEQTIKSLYGGHVPVVPMTKIKTRPPRQRWNPAGMEKFRAVIATRVAFAQAEESAVFANSDVPGELIQLSGGQPLELMHLVREAIVTGGLPVDRAGVARARDELRRSFERQMREDYRPILREVRAVGKVTRTRDNERAFRELLHSRMILLYMNHDEWYGLNPGVVGLQPARTLVQKSRQPASKRNA